MSRIPDLVRDSELESSFHTKYTIHRYFESDVNSGQRTVVREEYWRQEKYVGGGAYGSVWLEKCIKGERDHNMRAVKEIRLPRHTHRKVDYNRELEAIAKFSHQRYVRCFVKSFGWYEHADTLYIAMEFFPKGDLHNYLSTSPPLPEPEAQVVVSQLVEGLNFLHDNGFAHRDLKPSNILIKSRPPEPWWVKIGDFGISKRTENGVEGSSTLKGTLGFMAPELHGFVDQSDCFHDDAEAASRAADMWSLGEIAFQLLTKEASFRNMHALFTFARDSKLFPATALEQRSITPAGIDLVRQLMNPAPRQRMHAEDALNHTWTASYRAPSPRPLSIVSSRNSYSDNEDQKVKLNLYPEPSARWSTVSIDYRQPIDSSNLNMTDASTTWNTTSNNAKCDELQEFGVHSTWPERKLDSERPSPPLFEMQQPQASMNVPRKPFAGQQPRRKELSPAFRASSQHEGLSSERLARTVDTKSPHSNAPARANNAFAAPISQIPFGGPIENASSQPTNAPALLNIQQPQTRQEGENGLETSSSASITHQSDITEPPIGDILNAKPPLSRVITQLPYFRRTLEGDDIELNVPQRYEATNQLQLWRGNLVVDVPQTDEFFERGINLYPEGNEYTHFRYTSVTCHPTQFRKEQYTLRPNLFVKPRNTEILVAINVYRWPSDRYFGEFLHEIFNAASQLRNKKAFAGINPMDYWKAVVVAIIAPTADEKLIKIFNRLGLLQWSSKQNYLTPIEIINEHKQIVGMFDDVDSPLSVTGTFVTSRIYEYTYPFGRNPNQLMLCLQDAQFMTRADDWTEAFADVLSAKLCITYHIDERFPPNVARHDIYQIWKKQAPNLGEATKFVRIQPYTMTKLFGRAFKQAIHTQDW